MTLNDVQFVEASRRLAEIAIHEGGENDAGRLDAIALRVLGRPLETAERKALEPVIRDLRDHAPPALAELVRDGLDTAPGTGLERR